METDQNLNLTQKDPSLKDRRCSEISSSRPAESSSLEKSCLNSIGIMPIMLFHGIANSGMLVIVQNFYIDRICRVSDNFTNDICLNLTQNSMDGKLQITFDSYSFNVISHIFYLFFKFNFRKGRRVRSV